VSLFLLPLGAVALLAGALALLRRHEPRPGMRVVARLPLEPRRGLIVVELAGRTLVLGSSDAGLSLVTELDSAQAACLVPAPTGAPRAWLASLVGKRA
jgi:flagellar biogenesis protein FliO